MSWASGPWDWTPSSWRTRRRPRHTLHRLARENYAIIYMTEALAGPLAADIDRYKSETTPAVILIPARGGSLGLGSRALQAAVERPLGRTSHKDRPRGGNPAASENTLRGAQRTPLAEKASAFFDSLRKAVKE